MLLYNQKRYAMAADEFRKELAQNPNSALSMAMLALSLVYDRKPNEALTSAQAAIAADPERAFVHYALASVVIGPGLRTHQLRYFRNYRLLWRQFWYRRRLRKATPHALEAIRLDPHNPDFLALMAAVELDLQNPWKSQEWSEKALAARPDHVRSINLRARALAKRARASEARETFQRALALDPDGAATRYQGGWTHLQVGDADQAVEHFTEAVRLDPNSVSAHDGLRAARRSIARRATRKLSWIGLSGYIIYVIFHLGSLSTTGFRDDDGSIRVIAIVTALCVIIIAVYGIRMRRRIRRRNR
jgi:tetratricopeptide (TPR) repeat protein